ncbi:MAG TPA: substrate-binding domain-containing protein [Candidatus Solibacter sp.]|jgi:phosphate transport system substrate-binding protein|nr:substrate-binding domain-containing protein [Candidatus Solibacter sp.]
MLGRCNVAPVAALAVIAITGCSSSSSPAAHAKSPTPKPSASPAIGSITIGGTAGDLRLIAAAKGPFQSANPQATIQATVSPLGGELTAVVGGSVGAGLTDYPKIAAVGLANGDKLVDHVVGINRMLIITDPNQTVGNLSIQQVGNLFAGKYVNWNQLGGADRAITLVGPPAQSATRRALDKLAMAGSPQAPGIMAQPTPRGVVQLVSTTPGAVGFVLASDLELPDRVRRLQVSGVDPTAENVERGTYPLWFRVHLYTLGPDTGAVAAFIHFLTSAKFQDSDPVQLAGFVPLDRVYGVSPSDQ